MIAFVTGGSGFVGRALIEALRGKGDEVRALVRSDKATETVVALGAAPVRGDLDDVAAMIDGMRGCDAVFHSAAHVKDWGAAEEFHRVNVQGTQNVIDAARSAPVPRLVHIGTEAALIGGAPIINADETRAFPARPIGLYPLTKGLAETRVRAANGEGLATVVVRPRFIWGKGDTSVLSNMVQAVKDGRFMWIGGGNYKTSTCHVRNVCEGALLAAEKGRGGEAYFLTDGEPVMFREFITKMLKTQGIYPGTKTMPRGVVYAMASVCELLWRALPLKGAPPINRFVVRVIGSEVTVNDAKARRELGYVGRVSIEEGLQEMREGVA
ncbi:MAG: NAD-dependent epimerase/dehydratase family protein [Candidatus Hydrogenedentes bacterium]|nr:NAD-dependent epimerase/dehydratase family protein [Candidatus Hydrogenedentota bacterium]